MDNPRGKYCLDANVLIEAWNKYYSPKFCKTYWDLLKDLGQKDIIFLPQLVAEEIKRTDDALSNCVKSGNIRIYNIDFEVTECLRRINEANPIHQYLSDNKKYRSLADPWVIAHAMKESACVVTKEEKITAVKENRIKIPNVCENMGVRWINDFQFIEELNIHFSCSFHS